MSRLIDADAFIKEMNNRCEEAIKWGINAIADHNEEIKIRAEQAVATFCEASLTAKKMPTIDAEPIIKCKDCKHFAIDDIEGFTINGKPLRYAVCKHKNGMRGITAYAYCSRAERKKDETN